MNNDQGGLILAILYWAAVVIGYVVLIAAVIGIPYMILKMLRIL